MIKFGLFEFDPAAGLLYLGDEETLLPPKAAGVLDILLGNAGKLVTKDELLESVWEGSFVTESSLTDAVSLLRQVLGDDARDPIYIQTLHRRGYRFIGDVEAEATETPVAESEAAPSVEPRVPQPSGLKVGDRLGDYEILGTLGAGAMGTVYRALDMSLEREVAIKALPVDFAADPERVARLEREAKLLASVSHPNIATIHSLEEYGGIRFPVLELVEGATLDQRLQAGRIKVDEALQLARQIASALEAAHEHGIIHRDLKPANIKVTPEGQVKVLDFGLAKALQVKVFGADASESPTESIAVMGSRRGSIVGTAAYMSPEQARGQETDKRADVWSFGCVLFELLAGQRAFEGETVSDTIAGVLEREPDWTALPPETPTLARSLLRRSLQKDPANRLHDIADARIEIEEALAPPLLGPEVSLATPSKPVWWRSLPWGVAALMALMASVVLWAPWRTSRLPASVERYQLILPQTQALRMLDVAQGVVISPDGTRIVYRGCRLGGTEDDDCQLYLHEIDTGDSRSIGEGDLPFFSPDGEWLGFVRQRTLMKVKVEGVSSPIPLTQAAGRGFDWGPDDTIVYVPDSDSGLWRIAAAPGSQPEELTSLLTEAGERAHSWPDLLPNGSGVLFSVRSGATFDDGEIVVHSFDTGERVTLASGSFPRYVPTGHLIYVRRVEGAATVFTGTLFARSFDVETKVTGPEVEILPDVYFEGDYGNGSSYSISETGKLVYAPGLPADRLVFLVDLEGHAERLQASPQLYGEARFSPDGKNIALAVHAHPDRIDLYELDHNRQSFLLSHVTDEEGTVWEYDRGVEWHPEGRLVTIHARSPRAELRLQALLISIDGSVDPELPLLGRTARAHGWTPDGNLLFTEITAAETRQDIWELTLDESRSARELAGGPGFQGQPAVSPDGRWLAYTSDHSGQAEVWAKAYGGSGPVKVSIDGGQDPLWAPDGKVIYFRDGEHVMAVDILTESELSAGTPRALFEDPYFIMTWVLPRTFDLSPAGDQFVMIQEGERWGTKLEVVNNWFEELKERVPTGR